MPRHLIALAIILAATILGPDGTADARVGPGEYIVQYNIRR